MEKNEEEKIRHDVGLPVFHINVPSSKELTKGILLVGIVSEVS
jgi:hypothetical protein